MKAIIAETGGLLATRCNRMQLDATACFIIIIIFIIIFIFIIIIIIIFIIIFIITKKIKIKEITPEKRKRGFLGVGVE